MGNRFARVLPEMLQGNAQNADGTFSRAKSPLAKLKVMCVRTDTSFPPLIGRSSSAQVASQQREPN